PREGNRIHQGVAHEAIRVRISAIDHSPPCRFLQGDRRCARLHGGSDEARLAVSVEKTTLERISFLEALARCCRGSSNVESLWHPHHHDFEFQSENASR